MPFGPSKRTETGLLLCLEEYFCFPNIVSQKTLKYWDQTISCDDPFLQEDNFLCKLLDYNFKNTASKSHQGKWDILMSTIEHFILMSSQVKKKPTALLKYAVRFWISIQYRIEIFTIDIFTIWGQLWLSIKLQILINKFTLWSQIIKNCFVKTKNWYLLLETGLHSAGKISEKNSLF